MIRGYVQYICFSRISKQNIRSVWSITICAEMYWQWNIFLILSIIDCVVVFFVRRSETISMNILGNQKGVNHESCQKNKRTDRIFRPFFLSTPVTERSRMPFFLLDRLRQAQDMEGQERKTPDAFFRVYDHLRSWGADMLVATWGRTWGDDLSYHAGIGARRALAS